MDRYYIRPDSDRADWRRYKVIDQRAGMGSPVASCRDPEMAQRIAELLNAEPLIEELIEAANALPDELEAILK